MLWFNKIQKYRDIRLRNFYHLTLKSTFKGKISTSDLRLMTGDSKYFEHYSCNYEGPNEEEDIGMINSNKQSSDQKLLTWLHEMLELQKKSYAGSSLPENQPMEDDKQERSVFENKWKLYKFCISA